MASVFTNEQMIELNQVKKTHPKAHLRTKAIALWNLGRGRKAKEICECLDIDRHTLSSWRQAYTSEGMAGLAIKPGRGRHSEVDLQEVLEVVRQSPRNFGLARERWTLKTLRQIVPSLGQLKSLRSIGYVLERAGLSYKRGQYQRLSPDPEYAKKKSVSRIACEKPEKTQRKS